MPDSDYEPPAEEENSAISESSEDDDSGSESGSEEDDEVPEVEGHNMDEGKAIALAKLIKAKVDEQYSNYLERKPTYSDDIIYNLNAIAIIITEELKTAWNDSKFVVLVRSSGVLTDEMCNAEVDFRGDREHFKANYKGCQVDIIIF